MAKTSGKGKSQKAKRPAAKKKTKSSKPRKHSKSKGVTGKTTKHGSGASITTQTRFKIGSKGDGSKYVLVARKGKKIVIAFTVCENGKGNGENKIIKQEIFLTVKEFEKLDNSMKNIRKEVKRIAKM